MFKTRISPTRASGLAAAGVLALLGAAACSSSTSAKSSAPASSQGAAAPAAAGSSGSAPSTAAAQPSVTTSSVAVAGTPTTVLVAPDGKTLYYFTPDTTASKATCTGTCAQAWPPLKAATPTAGAGVTGSLAAPMGPNGDQVTYNGHPLYEYTGDMKAGQANGQGVLGKWFVATPALIVGGNVPSSSPTAPPSSGGGTGGYGNY
jgi:predicted lipoprotein with Yx(FWY)xxD motif